MNTRGWRRDRGGSTAAALRRVPVLVTLGFALSCASLPEEAGTAVAELEEWAAGPVRWLLLPAEQRYIQTVSSPGEAVNFIERFWSLRDPDPTDAVNPFRELFGSRVEAADLLYGEEGLRGALTARGRALILLGPTAHLQVGTEPVLSWSSGRRSNRRVTTRDVGVEVWRYPPESLPPRYERALRAEGHDAGAELRFHVTPRGSRLVDGEVFLALAAKVALASD